MSLGSVFEGLSLALSEQGFGLTTPEPCPGPPEGPFAPAWRAAIRPLGTKEGPDPLAAWLPRRRAYRGRFREATAAEAASLAALVAMLPEGTLLAGAPRLARLARRYDAASYGFAVRPEYEAELYGWMRFRKGSPDWRRDGLTADCMALGAAERWAGAVLLHPRVYPLMRAMGLGRTLISGAPQIASAAALLLFHAPAAEIPFALGRRFHRLWLTLAAAGWHACPLSSLADDPAANAELHREGELPADHRLVNVLRVGKAPVGPGKEPAESPRLPAAELLI
jgi:hypothetical protein